MKRSLVFCMLIIAVAGGALMFRCGMMIRVRSPRKKPASLKYEVAPLDLKPFHGDEANQAYKCGSLIDQGFYQYDPNDHHGPTLYYLTLPSAWLTSDGTFAGTNEFTFRIVPVIFGVGLVLLLLLVGDGIGRPAAVCAGILTAISPAMVYYSRYYIQEMLLVFFTFAAIGAGWRYIRTRHIGWALATGAALGLMHATKETCILAFAAMGAALATTIVLERLRMDSPPPIRAYLKPWHIVAAVGIGLAVSVTFFTSFFTHARGPLDSILTYVGNTERSTGMHNHPWYHYLKLLAYHHVRSGPWWSEGLILALAAVGFFAAIVGRGVSKGRLPLTRFLAVYTLLMTAGYSIIPYKTPWCMLGFLHGMILLAGVGAAVLVRIVPTKPARIIAGLLIAAAACQLYGQACRTIGRRFCADQRNPYVYVHSVSGIVRLGKRIEDIAQVHPAGNSMFVTVVAQDSWPLPFYLRRMKRVGYWPDPGQSASGGADELPPNLDAPVIVASTEAQQRLEELLKEKFNISEIEDEFMFSFHGQRPQVLMLLYVRKPLWDAYMQKVMEKVK